MQQVQLGPFEIQSRFATGGMGEIWRGKHLSQDVPVAIKVITGANALLPEYQDEFRREVQAVARLRHPNIVEVLDYGNLPEDVAGLSGDLRPGSPYLVMEYASRGSLANQLDPLNWRDLKNILMSVLGALAHAHARDVIHRDIKPGNVLLGSHHETPPRIILTDFGVAHATDRQTRTDAMDLTARSTEEASGTPRYMAPEQFMGKWRNYGPWTDLYAVGIMAYELACGKLPFTGGTFMVLAMAHINNPMPHLSARIEVPEGFEDWIKRITAKKPAERYQCAADAAWALTQLDDSHLLFSELSNIAGEQEYEDDDFDDSTDMLPTRIDFAPPEALRVFTMSKTSDEKSYPDAPALPLTWQEAAPPAANSTIVGAGLGLFGLRSIPLVDRKSERTALWSGFKETHLSGQQRAIVLKGLAGTGKSRLGEWLTQLADEVGAATVLQGGHGPVGSPTHGIGWMLTRHFRSAGLSAEDMQERVENALATLDVEDDFQAKALTDIMRSNQTETDTSSKFVPFTSPEQRFGVIRKLLRKLTEHRPVLIFLDDIQWGWESIEFVKSVLNDAEDYPVYFVLALREEALAEREDEEMAMASLLALDNTKSQTVAPLARTDVQTLLEEHLLLPQSLASDVARQSAGSPLFAIQVVEDWVKRGILVVRDSKLAIKEGEKASIPKNLSEVWESRLEYLIRQLSSVSTTPDETQRARRPLSPEHAHESLQLAAALGQDVETSEWLTVAQKAGIPAHAGIVDEMARLRMATQNTETDGFSFISAQLRESLIRQSEEEGNWKKHNMLCAQVLTSLYSEDHDGLAERVGRHFLEAKAYQLAVTCLQEAYRRMQGAREQNDLTEINDLLALTYKRMGVSEDDPRWAELWVRRGVPMIYSENPITFKRGRALLERAEEIARNANKTKVLASILRAQAWACAHSGEFEKGIEKAEEAEELVSDYDSLLAAVLRTHGHVLLESGDHNAAAEYFERTLELSSDSVHAIWAHQQLAECARRDARYDDARELLASALEHARDDAVSLAEAAVLMTRAKIEMIHGELEDAIESTRAALDIRELAGSNSVLALDSNELLARLYLLIGDEDLAEPILDDLNERLEEGARSTRNHISDTNLLAACRAREWQRVRELMDDALDFERRMDSVHIFTLQGAIEIAARAGQSEVAEELAERLIATAEELEVEFDRDAIDAATNARPAPADPGILSTKEQPVPTFDEFEPLPASEIPDFEPDLAEESEPEEHAGVGMLTPEQLEAARDPSSNSFLPVDESEIDPQPYEATDFEVDDWDDNTSFEEWRDPSDASLEVPAFDEDVDESGTEVLNGGPNPAVDLELAELAELELEPPPDTGSRLKRVKAGAKAKDAPVGDESSDIAED